MGNINVKRKKSILILVLIMSVSFLIGGVFGVVSLAKYTNSQYAQRTVSPYESLGERFSSNTLAIGASKDNVKTFYVTDASLTPSGIITVCNYEKGRQTLPFVDDIEYSVTVRLVKYDANEEALYVPVDAAYMTTNSYGGYSFTVSDGVNTVTLSSSNLSDNQTFSGTLAGGAAHSDAYTVTFSDNFAPNQPNLYVEMIVEPDQGGLNDLQGILKTAIRAQGATSLWTGDFTDDPANAPSAYENFNYRITGQGEGTATLEWDGAKVGLREDSLIMLMGLPNASKVGNRIVFDVDSDVTDHYDLWFYKINITTETWPQMRTSVVTFSFT